MPGKSPTQRTLEWYKNQGYVCGKVELWIPGTKITRDLYGFADLEVFGYGEVVLVQCTTWPNFSSRNKKILANENAKKWIMNNKTCSIHLVAWGKKKGSKKWEPKIKWYKACEFDDKWYL